MNALITRLRAPRPLWAHVLRLVVVRTVGGCLLLGAILCGQAMAMQPTRATLDATIGADAPTWSAAEATAYPDCVAAADWPANTWGSAVIGFDAAGTTSRVDFDEAWERSHNHTETDDLTVLGICA